MGRGAQPCCATHRATSQPPHALPLSWSNLLRDDVAVPGPGQEGFARGQNAPCGAGAAGDVARLPLPAAAASAVPRPPAAQHRAHRLGLRCGTPGEGVRSPKGSNSLGFLIFFWRWGMFGYRTALQEDVGQMLAVNCA